MLCTQHPCPSVSLERKCLSSTDLLSLHWSVNGLTHSSEHSSYSDLESQQPIKRSRSDQSLHITANAAAGHPSSSGAGVGNQSVTVSLSQQLQLCGGQHQHRGILAGALNFSPYGSQNPRVQRAPSLPVVLSDVGSSTNSLLSLDSDVPRIASQQHFNLLPATALGVGPTGFTRMGDSEPAAQNGNSAGSSSLRLKDVGVDGVTPAGAGVLHASSSRCNESPGVLCSLNPVSSAASLTQAALWPSGYDLARTASDASLSSAGYSAALQQLGPPLPAYSPPPLLSPDLQLASPSMTDSAGVHGAAVDVDAVRGAATKRPGWSIQQHKQASFQGPSHTSDAVVVTAALGSSSWGMRPVNSTNSLHSSESITSVDAGERLAGLRFGLNSRQANTPSPSMSRHVLPGAPNQLPPLSPSLNAGPPGTPTVEGHSSSNSVGGCGVVSLSARPAAGSNAAGSSRPDVGSSPVPAVTHTSGRSSLTSPGVLSEASDAGTVTVASPAIELQPMGSVLGDDGQWLLNESSTGVIGVLSPTRAVLTGGDQGVQGPARDAAQPAVQASAVSAAIFSALPAVSSASAQSSSMPVVPTSSSAFGFSSSTAGAAAAAAAAARLCMLDSRVPAAPSRHPAAAKRHSPFNTFGANPASSQGHGDGSCQGSFKGTSAPLPGLSSAQPRDLTGGGRMAQMSPWQQPPEQEWSFARRHASLDCARKSFSSRRRGSLELNMPWRKTLDAAIAKAAAEPGSTAQGASSQHPSDSSMGVCGSAGAAADGMHPTARELPVSPVAGAALGPWPLNGAASQLDVMLPLLEADDEALSSPCVFGPGSIGPGSMGSAQRGSFDADMSSISSHSGLTSSCGNSVAADHDLPGSTNVGGYIGGSDSLGLSRHSLESPTAAGAIKQQAGTGFEADGASLMQAVAPGLGFQGQHALSSAISLHSLQKEQFRVVTAHGNEASVDIADAAEGGGTSSASQCQQQQTHPDHPRKPAACEAVNPLDAPTAALAVESLLPADLQSNASASSISSRGSPGLFSRRGANSGASRDLELFVRLNRARQTLDFAKRQAQAFAELDKAELSVWDALGLLDSLHEYEAGLLHAAATCGTGVGGGSSLEEASTLTPDMPLKDHAFQVAELCRLSFPDKPWMALVGLMHGLGKLLAHPMWGCQPQWAVAGESFPVGCKFAPQISASEFFSANPDRRRRTYSSSLGVYQERCGLRNVYMSWGAAEYLYMLLVLNQTQLPEEALFMIRYQRCFSITLPGSAYRQLMSAEDRQQLPTLAAFQSILQYRRVPLPAAALQGQQLYDHYNNLISTYLGQEALFW